MPGLRWVGTALAPLRCSLCGPGPLLGVYHGGLGVSMRIFVKFSLNNPEWDLEKNNPTQYAIGRGGWGLFYFVLAWAGQ